MRSAHRLGIGTLLVAGLLAAVPVPVWGTAPPAPLDPASAGDATLEVWTAEYGPRLAAVEQRIAEFQEAYPNVSVNITVRDFGSYPAQVRLALSGGDPPDVLIGNLGYSLDGPLIGAGLLRELTPWVEQYGWDERYTDVTQQQLRFSTDGRRFGDGPIYGIPYAADVIGWYYNREKLDELGLEPPATFTDLEAAFATAQEAGEVPIMLGNLAQWPSLHLFFTVNNNYSTTEEVSNFVFADPDATLTAPSFVDSAEKFAAWAEAGFLVEGFNGLDPADANVRFADGESVFLAGGSWNTPEFITTMGDNVGFFLTPPNEAGEPRRATGSFGYGWHISAASEHPDLAAALIDFLTDDDWARALFANGDIAPLIVSDPVLADEPVSQEVYESWLSVLENDTLLPYLDFAVPNPGEVMYPVIQQILAGDVSPTEGLADIQAARAEFIDSITS